VKLRRGVPVAVAGVLATLVVSGCSQLTPGTAAVVNGTRISNDQVQDLAQAQCTAADKAKAAGQSQTMSISRVKAQSLGLLMDTELSLQYAKDEKITPDTSLVNGFYSQFEPGITPLPTKARTTLTDVFGSWAKGRAILVQAGAESTGQQVSLDNLQQLLDAGLKDRTTWLKKASIDTDPRYAPGKDGFPGNGDGSVSKASSTFAKAAGAAQQDPSFVSGLPAGQKCG
jgi:hypothetical protein